MVETDVGMSFDKNDVVIVAIAKIESEIRKNVRESKSEIERIDKELVKLNGEYKRNGRNNAPKIITDKEKFYNDIIKKSKDSLKVVVSHTVEPFKESLNNYTVTMQELNEHNRPIRTINILYKSAALTARQKAIIVEKENLNKERIDQVQRGVDWKKKLSDIPAAERQMKAVVVENELNKSKEGQALVALLTKEYLGKIKEIEM